ncbi:MAG: nuclear transport factor 2 family protein [Acidobacteriia bacterium]|nr:nuclear transport factor 2 family protein [Terriglobia bacterium]
MASLLLGAATIFTGSQAPSPQSADSSAEGAALDDQLTEVYLRQDWAALEKIVAPDYSGFAADEQWDFSALKREFPKIHLVDLHVERQQVKRLSHDLILVSDVLTMHETYAGQDISGRYWSSDIWVRRNGKWLLLVEQEVPLK